MPDIKQALRDFVATSNSGKYSDEETLLSKFPELQGYDIQVLRDFVTTSNSGKYETEEELFSKFPEFNIESLSITPKKKEESMVSDSEVSSSELPSGDGSYVKELTKKDKFTQVPFEQRAIPEVTFETKNKTREKEEAQKRASTLQRKPYTTEEMEAGKQKLKAFEQGYTPKEPGIGGIDFAMPEVKSESTRVEKPIDIKTEKEKEKQRIILEEQQKKRQQVKDLENWRQSNIKSDEAVKLEKEKRDSAFNRSLTDIELSSSLLSVNQDLIDNDQNTAIEELTNQFGKYGFNFKPGGEWLGHSLIVSTDDGKNSIKIDLKPGSDELKESESLKLRNFISNYNIVPETKKSFIDQEGENFYKERNRDYYTEKRRWERYNELNDIVGFFEGYSKKGKEKVEQQYPDLFYKGDPVWNIGEKIQEYKQELETLRPLLKDDTFFSQTNTAERTREDFDAFLAKKENEIIKSAAEVNKQAKVQEDVISEESRRLFNMDIQDLIFYKSDNPEYQKEIDNLINKFVDAQDTRKGAAARYEFAKLYYNEKVNKDINGDLTDNFVALWNTVGDNYKQGLVNDQLLALAMPGMYIPYSGTTDLKEASEYIINKLNSQSGTQSRVETRLQNAKTRQDYIDVMLDNPLESMVIAAAGSLSLMLPTGFKIIPAFTAGGAYAGSVVPGVGTVLGAGRGFEVGQAVNSYALEYTSAIMEAVENSGYNPMDPESLAAGLADEKVWKNATDQSLARGIPIALADYMSSKLTGRVFKPSSKLDGLGKRIALGAAERVIVDPALEAAGEALAQSSEIFFGTGRGELDIKEIIAEGRGALGSKLPNMIGQLYYNAKTETNAGLASNLTKIHNVGVATESDEKISNWANNMQQLGKIDADVNQRIQENVGLRRDAKELLNIGTTEKKSEGPVVSRVMELLSAKKELSATKNRQEVYAEKIKEINNELATISQTKQLLPDDKKTNLDGIIEARREDVSEYKINGVVYNKDKFLSKLNSMSSNRLMNATIGIKGDEETSKLLKDKVDAIQKQTAGEVPVQPKTGVGEEVVQGKPEAGLEVTPEQGVLSPEEKEKLTQNRRVDLFPEESEFADVIGGSGRNSSLSDYNEVNGVGIASYTNPDNGLVDVIMSGTSDNDYVGYVRVYENGKPTNRWTSKMSNESGNKENFKTMISEVQSRLPENHEYTEKTNISIDGVRVYSNQLNRGYEILTDENGNPVTNTVTLNAATVQGLQQATTQEEKQSLYDNMTVTTKEQFDALRDKIKSLMPNTEVSWNQANNTVQIQLPVLVQSGKAKTEQAPVTQTPESIEKRREAELNKLPNGGIITQGDVITTSKEADEINAKYDAELAKLKKPKEEVVTPEAEAKVEEVVEEVPVEEKTPEQEADLLEELITGKKKEPVMTPQVEVMKPEAEVMTPEAEVMTPEAKAEEEMIVQPEFTEQDQARKRELEDALKKADKRKKNVMVGEVSMPKAEVKAELDALKQKEQTTAEVKPAVTVQPEVTKEKAKTVDNPALANVEATTKALEEAIEKGDETSDVIEELFLRENGNYKLFFRKIAERLYNLSKGLTEKPTKAELEKKGINLNEYNNGFLPFAMDNESKILSEAYHEAKKNGKNPELVQTVEEALGKPEKKKGKKLSDTIRGFEIKGPGGLQSNIFGIPIAIWNSAVKTTAAAVDASVAIAEALQRGANKIKDWISKNDPSNKLSDEKINNKILRQVFAGVIKTARENNVSEEGIRVYLKRNGLSDEQIDIVVKKREQKAPPTEKEVREKTTAKKVDVKEIKEIEQIVKLQEDAIKEGKKSVQEAIKEFIRLFNKSKVVTKLTRSDLNKIINLMEKVKDFDSLQKAVGNMYDIILKSNEDIIEVSEKKQKEQFKKEFKKGVREGKGDLNSKRKALATAINDMVKKGTITLRQANAIIKRVNFVNLDNPIMIDRLIEYAGNIFNDADYDTKMQEVRKLQNQVKRKNHTSTESTVREFTSINPELIPDNKILQYIQALDDMNTGTPSYAKMNNMFDEVMSYKTEPEGFNAIKTFQKLMDKLESIALNKVKSVEDYVNLIRDINAFKRNALKLLENGSITQKEYDEVIENVGKDQAAVEKKYEKELAALKKDLVSEIEKLRPETNPDFTAEENAMIEKYLEIGDKNLEQLAPEELYILNDLLQNIKDGQMDYYRFADIVSKAYSKDAIQQTTEQVKKSKFDLALDKGKELLSEYESSFWEGLLGLGRVTSGALQKFIVSPVMRAIGSYEKFIQDSYKEFSILKKKYGMNNKEKMNKLGMLTTYLQEYMAQFDPENQGVKDIGKRDWFKEILNSDRMKSKYPSEKFTTRRVLGKLVGGGKTQLESMEKIWNSLPKDKDGNVDPKAVYDSYMANDGKFFSKKEKEFFDKVMEWKQKNTTTKQKAANELRGNPFKEMPFHMLRSRYDANAKQISPKSSVANGMVRIEAGTGKERKDQSVGPININFEELFIEGVEQTARDYFLSGAIQDVNNVLSGVSANMGENQKIVETITGAISEALNFEFEKSSNILGNILSARATMVLLDAERTVRETLAGLVSYPIRAKTISGYKDLFRSVKKMKDLLEFTQSPLRLRENIGSSLEISDGQIQKMNALQRWTFYLAGLPERTMMVTSWMPTFRSEFKNITGSDFNMEAFKTDKAYKEKFGKAIREASAVADAQTEKIIGTTAKAGQRRNIRIAPEFLANLVGLKGTVKKNTAAGQIIGFFTNYPYREVTEFFNGFREAAEILRNKGFASSPEAAAQLSKPLGIIINVAVYGYLASMSYALQLMALGDEDDEERGKTLFDEMTTTKGILEDFQGNAISLLASRYGIGSKALLQIGGTVAYVMEEDAEKKKMIKKFMKGSIYVDPLPIEKATQYGGKEAVAASIASYIPQLIVLADRLVDASQLIEDASKIYNKAEKDGVDSLTEKQQIQVLVGSALFKGVQLGLNFAGTSLPFYGKLKIYEKKLRTEAGIAEKTKSSEKREAYGGFKTIEELEIADPKKYKELSKKGGPLYEFRQKENAQRKANEEKKAKEYEEKYGVKPKSKSKKSTTEGEGRGGDGNRGVDRGSDRGGGR